MGYLFTSESVSEGHPDKVADQISDALLDEFLRWDPESKVACETFVTTGLVVCGGEVRTEDRSMFRKLPGRSSEKLDIQKPNTVSIVIRAVLFRQFMNSQAI